MKKLHPNCQGDKLVRQLHDAGVTGGSRLTVQVSGVTRKLDPARPLEAGLQHFFCDCKITKLAILELGQDEIICLYAPVYTEGLEPPSQTGPCTLNLEIFIDENFQVIIAPAVAAVNQEPTEDKPAELLQAVAEPEEATAELMAVG